MLTTMIDMLMSAEADAVCGVGHGERSKARVNQRNGYRHPDFDTRAGTLDLATPQAVLGQLRLDGLLERRRRAEAALTSGGRDLLTARVGTRVGAEASLFVGSPGSDLSAARSPRGRRRQARCATRRRSRRPTDR